ncbi:serine/threonine protein kinase, partial [Bacillus cereus]|nr:serine/threonine protein kinase [Bacillus cereus]
LEHSINYEYAKVIFDKNSGYIDKISKYNLPLINNSSCITHKFFKVNNVPSELFKQSNASGNVKFISSTTELKQITKNIIESAKSLDIEMENYYGIGWLDNGEFLNEHNFANLKLASNNKNFSDFTRNLNASMVEVIERVGTNNQINKYYYNEFQTNYPDLFYALDRLKVYRNSMQHNDLNSHTLEKYLKYIETDLGGSFPEFLPNGYLILQSVILNDIYSAIKKTSEALRKVLL